MPLNPIEEIRAIRAAIMREFDDDADKYCDYLEEKWKDSGLKFVTPTPRRIKAVSAKSPKRNTAARKNGKKKRSA